MATYIVRLMDSHEIVGIFTASTDRGSRTIPAKSSGDCSKRGGHGIVVVGAHHINAANFSELTQANAA